LLHKHQIPERLLTALLELKKKTKAYGLIMAHSGTLIGLLHEGDSPVTRSVPNADPSYQKCLQHLPARKIRAVFHSCKLLCGQAAHLELQIGARANYDFAWG
jgi:hypothetical protein